MIRLVLGIALFVSSLVFFEPASAQVVGPPYDPNYEALKIEGTQTASLGDEGEYILTITNTLQVVANSFEMKILFPFQVERLSIGSTWPGVVCENADDLQSICRGENLGVNQSASMTVSVRYDYEYWGEVRGIWYPDDYPNLAFFSDALDLCVGVYCSAVEVDLSATTNPQLPEYYVAKLHEAKSFVIEVTNPSSGVVGGTLHLTSSGGVGFVLAGGDCREHTLGVVCLLELSPGVTLIPVIMKFENLGIWDVSGVVEVRDLDPLRFVDPNMENNGKSGKVAVGAQLYFPTIRR